MLTRNQIFEGVRDVLVGSLFVDRREIKPEATLMADLGAASVDFLDIAFLLERKFGVKIRTRNFAPEDMFENGDLESDMLTERGMNRVAAGQLSWVDPSQAMVGTPKENLFTVHSICAWIEGALQEKEEVALIS